MSHVEHLHGNFTHRNAITQMAESDDIFDNLSQQQTFEVSDPGMANRIAGLAIYNQVNMNTPIVGALPDIDRTGDESIDVMTDSPAATFRAAFNRPTVSGVAGGGSVPTAQEWDFRTVEARIKIISMAIESDFIHEIESMLGHDTVSWERLMELGGQYVDVGIERDGVARPVDGDDTNAQYTDDDMIVMLDRVVASEDERSNANDAAGDAYSAGALDVYDVDRSETADGASNESNWFDAQVDHGSGTLRQLTRELINEHIDNQVANSSAEYENLMIITGRDTARVMSDFRDSQMRGDALQSGSTEQVNDAETRFGHNFTSRISHWDNIPIVVAPSVPGQSLSRIYVLDPTPGQTPPGTEALPKIGIETYRQPDAWTAGPDTDVHPLATGNFANEGLWASYQEVVCRDAQSQGKIIEIEE